MVIVRSVVVIDILIARQNYVRIAELLLIIEQSNAAHVQVSPAEIVFTVYVKNATSLMKLRSPDASSIAVMSVLKKPASDSCPKKENQLPLGKAVRQSKLPYMSLRSMRLETAEAMFILKSLNAFSAAD